MVERVKTKGIRLCESSVLGKMHKDILDKFKNDVYVNNSEDETYGYTLQIFYDQKVKFGFAVISYKIFHEDYSTDVIKERLIKLDENSFFTAKEEYELFIK